MGFRKRAIKKESMKIKLSRNKQILNWLLLLAPFLRGDYKR